MNRRPISILSAAALLALPTIAVARDDDRRDDRDSKREQRAGAGTVTSFTGSQLVITLADGSTITGRVTKRTEFECSRMSSSSASRSKHGSDDAPGDDRGGDRDRDRSDDSPSPSPSPNASPSPSPNASPKPSPNPSPSPSPSADYPTGTSPAGASKRARCGRGMLVAGAPVRKSRVRNGTFKKVHLYRR